jgi:hypothetical protein
MVGRSMGEIPDCVSSPSPHFEDARQGPRKIARPYRRASTPSRSSQFPAASGRRRGRALLRQFGLRVVSALLPAGALRRWDGWLQSAVPSQAATTRPWVPALAIANALSIWDVSHDATVMPGEQGEGPHSQPVPSRQQNFP